jgi:hypothetical protein
LRYSGVATGTGGRSRKAGFGMRAIGMNASKYTSTSVGSAARDGLDRIELERSTATTPLGPRCRRGFIAVHSTSESVSRLH